MASNKSALKRAMEGFVTKSFQQAQEVDFTDTFAPVINFTLTGLFFKLVARHNLELLQMDVPRKFLHADLKENMFKEV